MSSRAYRCPKCQPPRLATRPPGPSVQVSRMSFTPPVHRHGTSSLTFTSPSATASVLHTCTTQAKRHVAHKAFAKVWLVTTQPTSWITLTITHHKMNTQGYLSTLYSQLDTKCIIYCMYMLPKPAWTDWTEIMGFNAANGAAGPMPAWLAQSGLGPSEEACTQGESIARMCCLQTCT
jgi:hypothetical protein